MTENRYQEAAKRFLKSTDRSEENTTCTWQQNLQKVN